MTKKRNFIKLGSAASVLSLALAGCVLFPTPKEEFVKGYETIETAKTVESSTTFQLTAKETAGHKNLDTETKDMLKLLNSASINLHTISDNVKKQSESDLNISGKLAGLNVNLDLNSFIDEKAKKLYMKTDKYADVLGSIASLTGYNVNVKLPTQLKGKIIDLGKYKQNELIDNTKIGDYPDDHFTKKGDVITLRVSGKDLKEDIFKSLENTASSLGENVGEEDLDTMMKVMEKHLTIGEVTDKATVQKGILKKQDIIVPMSLNTKGSPIELELNIRTVYDNIDKPAKLSYKVNNNKTLTMDEVEKKLTDSMFK